MPTKINGLPAHVLLVHVVIVLVPISAFMLVASAVWPAARAKLGFLTPAAALVALIFVPITTNAGHWLKAHIQVGGATLARVNRHAALGGTLLPWAIGIFVVAAVLWVLHRRFDMSWRASSPQRAESAESIGFSDSSVLAERRPTKQLLPVWITAVVAVAAIAVSVGGLVQLYRIGDSGAKSVWTGVTH